MTDQEKMILCAGGVFKDCLKLLSDRSVQYAAPHSPFANFEQAADVAQTDVLTGLMTRFGDKLGRIQTGLREIRESDEYVAPSDESLKDSFLDAINYLALGYVYLETLGGADYSQLIHRTGVLEQPDAQPALPGFATERDEEPRNWFTDFLGRK